MSIDDLRGMRNTAETRLANRQIEGRARALDLDDIAARYATQAEQALEGKDADATAIGYELALAADKISLARGFEQDAQLERLVRALNFPKRNILNTVPEEERAAFALALIHAYEERQLH